MKPLPPAGSPHRRGMPQSLIGPSSSSAFTAAADGDHDAAVSEHAYVTLKQWWLATAEGDDQERKIAVAGIMQKNQTLYTSAPIAKCYKPDLLQTEDRAVIWICGLFSVSESYKNGYSYADANEFQKGFPDSWQSYKPQPKSDIECQPCSSNASNSGGDSTQFYQEMLRRGEHVMSFADEFLKSYSHKDAVFQKSSHLLNGRPRFEKYIDDDITKNENAAASSEAATGDQRTPVGSLEVHGCHKETQHMSLTENAANNAVSELVHSTPALGTDRKKTPVASLKSQGPWRKKQHIASNKKPVGQPKKRISSHEKCRSATTRFAGTRNPASYVLRSPLTRGKATALCMSTPEALNLKRSRSGRVIVPKLDIRCQSIVYGEDGWIAAVIGLYSPAVPKCSESKTDRRKKRKTK